jgi:hypothetical protein
MNTRDLLLQELDETSDLIIVEVLDFLRYLKAKEEREQQEDQEDLAEALVVLEAVKTEGTVSWDEVKDRLGLSS